jgi:hypothetical protein
MKEIMRLADGRPGSRALTPFRLSHAANAPSSAQGFKEFLNQSGNDF